MQGDVEKVLYDAKCIRKRACELAEQPDSVRFTAPIPTPPEREGTPLARCRQ